MVRGALLGLLAALPAAAGERPDAAAALRVTDARGAVLFETVLARSEPWCLVWNHSVTGIEVSDCFRQDAGRLVLARSHQPDFAAGLGDIPGRGHVRSDGQGGYWIEDIDMVLPGDALPLRVGGPRVDHRLRIRGAEHSLTALAAGQRVTLRLALPGRGGRE